jgi:hypothetical protein
MLPSSVSTSTPWDSAPSSLTSLRSFLSSFGSLSFSPCADFSLTYAREFLSLVPALSNAVNNSIEESVAQAMPEYDSCLALQRDFSLFADSFHRISSSFSPSRFSVDSPLFRPSKNQKFVVSTSSDDDWAIFSSLCSKSLADFSTSEVRPLSVKSVLSQAKSLTEEIEESKVESLWRNMKKRKNKIQQERNQIASQSL